MRGFAAILFWVGLFSAALEWWHARKIGPAITRGEKIYLFSILPVLFAVQLQLDLMGIAPAIATLVTVLGTGAGWTAWALARRVQRKARNGRPSSRQR